RTMPAAAFAAVSSPQMILCCKNQQARFVEVKFTGSRGIATGPFLPERNDAGPANARPFPHFLRDSRQKFIRNTHPRAPARSRVRVWAAKWAAVGLPAQRTPAGQGGLLPGRPTSDLAAHLSIHSLRRTTKIRPAANTSNVALAGSGTTDTASTCVLPLNTSIR